MKIDSTPGEDLLEGAELDRLVARADGYTRDTEDRSAWLKDGDVVSISAKGVRQGFGFRPSTNWADGGPIVERERIGFVFNGEYWTAWPTPSDPTNQMRGPTPLVAAMRAFVASKFGAEAIRASKEKT